MDKLKAKIIVYLCLMDESEIYFGGISPRDVSEGFTGCDDRNEAYWILKSMVRDGILNECETELSVKYGRPQYTTFKLTDCIME